MKKEEYCNQNNAMEKIRNWKREVALIKSHHPYQFNINEAALLVLDMQKYFLNPSSHAFIPSAPGIIPNINKLIQNFTKHNRPILFTQHCKSPSPSDPMLTWWGDSIASTDDSFKISSQIQGNPDSIIKKHHYSALYHTHLDKLLHDYHIKQVLITGVMTHLCCETTARDAFMHGYQVFFLMDATATYTEQLHVGTLRSIAHGFGICEDTNTILSFSKIK